MRLMQRKMQFVAYEMASILQNIAEQKKGSPVTGQDFISAMRIAYLSIYFGNTMNDSKSPHEAFKLGHHPYVGIYFIRGLGNDNIKIVWSRRCHGGNKNLFAEGENNATRCSVNMSATTATAFHPALIISENEEKIALDCCLNFNMNSSIYKVLPDGSKRKINSSREIFGFLFVNPIGVGSERFGFFPAVSIFSPPPQSFSDTYPQ